MTQKNNTPQRVLEIINSNAEFKAEVNDYVRRGMSLEGAFHAVVRKVRQWFPPYQPYKSFGSFEHVLRRELREKLKNNVPKK